MKHLFTLVCLLALLVNFTNSAVAQPNGQTNNERRASTTNSFQARSPSTQQRVAVQQLTAQPTIQIATIPAQGRWLTAVTSQTFAYSGTIVQYTVPTGVTSLSIEVRGAEGANNNVSAYRPGKGAVITGTVSVTSGQQLKVLVGQHPADGGNGGGGGSFVMDINNNPLFIAGGGGGSGNTDDALNKQGQSGTSGGNGANNGGVGGANGQGGKAVLTETYAAGAGGGLLTNGATSSSLFPNIGGKAFVNGGAGGSAPDGIAPGGFGGGGSGSASVSGAGGGGASGGGGRGGAD